MFAPAELPEKVLDQAKLQGVMENEIHFVLLSGWYCLEESIEIEHAGVTGDAPELSGQPQHSDKATPSSPPDVGSRLA